MLLTEEELKIQEALLNRTYVETCPKCEGSGYIHYEDDDGYTLSKECSCTKKVKRDLQLLDWGIPKRYIFNKSAMGEVKEQHFFPQLEEYISSYSKDVQDIQNLFVCGTNKNISSINTVLSKKIAMTKMKNYNRYYKVAYSLLNDILSMKLDDDSTKTFNSFMYKSDVLIIDGIGFELGRNANKFSQRQLENTIKKRDNACTPTILTSTLKLSEIKEIYGQDVYDFIISGMVIEAYPIKGDYF